MRFLTLFFFAAQDVCASTQLFAGSFSSVPAAVAPARLPPASVRTPGAATAEPPAVRARLRRGPAPPPTATRSAAPAAIGAAVAASALLGAAKRRRIMPAPSAERNAGSRARPSRMALEAFDLLPLADCVLEETFRIADADKIQACVDKLEPYFSLGEDLEVTVSQRFLDGLTGGAFGAIGTLFFTLRKKQEVKDNLICAYCEGSGHIDCGRCLSHGKMQIEGSMPPAYGPARPASPTAAASFQIIFTLRT